MFKLIVIFFICLVNIDAYGLFTYDRVAHLMQKGEFDKAKPLLQKMVVNSPENPEILYDAGVASYKTKDFKQAAAYFKQAATKKSVKPALQEKAYFNSANVAVELKQLEAAIADYEHVLEINPDNERAKHNLQKVKEMLNKQQQDNKQDNKDKKDEQKKEDKDKQNQDKDQQDKNDSEQDKKEKEESEQNKQSGDQQKDQQQNKQDQEQSKKDQDQQKNDDAGKKDDEQEKREQEKAAEDKKAAEEKKSEEDKDGSSSAKAAQETKEQQAKAAQEQAQEDVMQKMAPHLVKILDEQEKKDAALHKMMVKQAVGNNMAGRNGQNNW